VRGMLGKLRGLLHLCALRGMVAANSYGAVGVYPGDVSSSCGVLSQCRMPCKLGCSVLILTHMLGC
jgi:hypothetical protein